MYCGWRTLSLKLMYFGWRTLSLKFMCCGCRTLSLKLMYCGCRTLSLKLMYCGWRTLPHLSCLKLVKRRTQYGCMSKVDASMKSIMERVCQIVTLLCISFLQHSCRNTHANLLYILTTQLPQHPRHSTVRLHSSTATTTPTPIYYTS